MVRWREIRGLEKGWQKHEKKGRSKGNPKRFIQAVKCHPKQARLPTVTHTDLGAVTCAFWGRRCALWRRYPPGCHCKARGSCWGCSASCWQRAGPSAAPAPAASGGSSRWRWPRPWWPREWVPGREGQKQGEPGALERKEAVQTAARPDRSRGRGGLEGLGTEVRVLSAHSDPSPSLLSLG